MNNGLMIVGIIVVIALIAGGAYYVSSSHAKAPAGNSSTIAYTSTVSSTSTTVQQTNVSVGANITVQTTSAPTTTVASNTSYNVKTEVSSSIGTYMTNSSGFTLYYLNSDTPYSGKSNCYGSCESQWPIFYAGTVNAAPGLNASAFGTITRTDGSKQTTYEGRPLYFFKDDSSAGQVNGNGEGGFEAFVVTSST
jgi:predicted lipoprotein with Yx(FWY)xxD motif